MADGVIVMAISRPNKTPRRLAAALALGVTVALGAAATPSKAQQQPVTPTKGELAKNNKLFLTLARTALKWDEPTEPSKIVGPLHYVGTAGLSSYLFVTKEGHILFNTGTPDSGPMIVESIKKLGFDPKEIKILINGHAHMDHAGAFAFFKKLTNAQVAIMEPDVAMVEDGGKSDFHYGHDWRIMGQPPVKVDRVLRDGDTVRLGDVLLVAHHTPGHTRGATTWETTLVDGGHAYHVVWPDGGGFNPGYRLGKEPTSYSGINADYRRTHHFLEILKPDIFLGAHAEWFGYAAKRDRAKTMGVQAWVNPEEYRQFVAKQKREFEDQVDLELGVTK
jgi:metallo-beta-lactamase class B